MNKEGDLSENTNRIQSDTSNNNYTERKELRDC